METIKNRGKIVVAEDEQILLKAITIELAHAGYEVLCATNGEEAVTLVKKIKPDLLILDILMPKMGGLEALAKVRSYREFRDLPVIILSNLSQDEDIERAQELNVQKYYIKATVDLAEVVRCIGQMLSDRVSGGVKRSTKRIKQ